MDGARGIEKLDIFTCVRDRLDFIFNISGAGVTVAVWRGEILIEDLVRVRGLSAVVCWLSF